MQDPNLTPGLSNPGSVSLEPDSPVQAAIGLVESFLAHSPGADQGDPASARAGVVTGNHFCVLMRGCGLLNAMGLHSASLVLFRSLQDALDVFAAVTSVHGAAKKWEQDNLKPSDAAKAWVAALGNPDLSDAAGIAMTLSDYRRALRSNLNRYSHGSYALCAWDLYYLPRRKSPNGVGSSGTLEVNHDRLVIEANAHSIDANLTATVLEFISVFETAYAEALKAAGKKETLASLRSKIERIMQDHTTHGCQDVSLPAEIRMLREHE